MNGLYLTKIYSENEKKEFNLIQFKSNFDYERIQSLFELIFVIYFELFQLKKNYNLLNLSTIEIRLQIQKIFSFPFYLWLMSILASYNSFLIEIIQK